MKKIVLGLLLAGAPMSAQAQTLFSDSLQTTLANGNWQQIGNGQIVASPVGGNALNFSATASGQDLVSQIINGTGPGQYRITVDYYCGRAGGCAGYLGLFPGGSTTTQPGSGDAWLATDEPSGYGTPFTLVSGANGFQRNVIDFRVTSGGSFGLKLEDFLGGGGNVAGDAYFRNLSVAAVPEPASWALMIGGFAMVGATMRRRRAAVRTNVSFA